MIIAIDIGGTKTLVARCEAGGTIVAQERFETPQKYEDFMKELEKNVAKITTPDCSMVSAAAPGTIDRANGIGIAFGNVPWRRVPLKQDIERITGLPTLLENDANLAGLAEAHQLNPIPHHVLYVTISTGIGTGFVTDGILDSDLLDSEGGRMLLEHDDKLQVWETFASGKAIVARYGKRAADIEDPETWKLISQDIAAGLYNLCAVLDPDHIIIGGGVGSHFPKYRDFLVADLQAMSDPQITIPPITQALQPEEAVIHGCIIYASQHEQHLQHSA